MTTFVIVHGAWGGGWEWTPVARHLRRSGHEAFTLTLTGYGDRHHLGPRVQLSTNVTDILSLLEFEDLSDVVLCAASYGGMAATWAADRMPDRVGLLVYVDALIPEDGQAGADLAPPAFGRMLRELPEPEGGSWVEVPDAILPPRGLIPEEVRDRYIARLRPQPLGTFMEPVRLTGKVQQVRRAFVRCTATASGGPDDPIEPMAARVRTEGWPYRELPLPHDPQLFDPLATARVLEELARDAGLAEPVVAAVPVPE